MATINYKGLQLCWDRFLIEGKELFQYMKNNFDTMFDGDAKIKHFDIRDEVCYDYGSQELKQVFGTEIQKELVPWIKKEFEEKVKETLQGSYDKESKVFTEEELKKLIVDTTNLSLPDAFLKEWLIKANEGKVTEAEVESDYPIYAKQLSWSLISNQVAKENSIQAEHADVIEKTKEMIREQFASSGLGAQMESSMDLFVDNYLKGNEGQNYMNLMTSVQNEKVLDLIQEKIKMTEKSLTIDEFKELLDK
jgi:trigger factor